MYSVNNFKNCKTIHFSEYRKTTRTHLHNLSDRRLVIQSLVHVGCTVQPLGSPLEIASWHADEQFYVQF